MRHAIHRVGAALVVLGVAGSLAAGAAHAQGRSTKNVMRQKLAHTQSILEAVVTSDWIQLETKSRELEELTNAPGWTVLKYPEYARYSVAFVRAVQGLRTAADARDLERAPEAYAAVTRACVDCHRYLARMRIAR